LIQPYAVPLIKSLLSLAETIVEGGAVKNPLEYYKELANRSSPWIALPETERLPSAKIYQVCSRGVKKLTAAMALSPQGIRAEHGELIHIVLLISAPTSSVPSFLALLAQTVRLLESATEREELLGSKSPAEAWRFLSELESRHPAAPYP
jgi:hypothetical protein